MSKRENVKTERLLNLMMALKATRRPLSKSRIREIIEGYRECATEEAFNRMFERDKDELRALGIPVTVESIDALWDDELGYRILATDYELQPIDFTADERAALAVAARVWSDASLSDSAQSAVQKLRAAGQEIDGAGFADLEPRVATRESAFEPMSDALIQLRAVRFAYRRGAAESVRNVQPWALKNWHGRWYVSGFDLDREAERVFRLDRVVGPVTLVGQPGAYTIPASHDPMESIRRSAQGGGAQLVTLDVLVRPGQAMSLRSRAVAAADGGDRARGDTLNEAKSGGTDTYEALTLVTDQPGLVERLTKLGDAVIVTAPEEMRAAVVAALTAARERHTGPPSGVIPEPPPDRPTTRKRGGATAETSTARLNRLLRMVPWLVARPGVPIEEASAQFGLTEQQLIEDLSLLFMCGLPGLTHGELIDASWDGGVVTVSNADTIDKPVKLTLGEAVSVIAGLRALSGTPGVSDAVDGALQRLRAAMPVAEAESADRITVDLESGEYAEQLATLREATTQGRQVRLHYVNAADEASERSVDPLRLANLDGRWYLQAWCHTAQGERLFRLDRVSALTVLDEAATHELAVTSPRTTSFAADEHLPLVGLRLSPAAHWIVDYYPSEHVDEGPPTVAWLRVADERTVEFFGLGHADRVEIVAPESARAIVRDAAERALLAYQQQDVPRVH